MRILGIDPGIGRTGWGVIDVIRGKPVVVEYDCFETKANGELAERIRLVYEELLRLLDTYQPDAVAIEELFFNTNAKTALIVGQARGVVLLAAAQKNLQIATYTPLEVKVAVAGYGKAEKAQVEKMVITLLKLTKKPKHDDAADALAVAITHAFSYRISGKKFHRS